MISFYTILIILVVHFLADFALQTNWQAPNKHKDNKALIYHTLSYSAIWVLVAWSMYQNIYYAFIFGVITFAAHTFTDWCTSRIGHNFWEAKNYHDGFVVVGFDQILHYIQLLLTHEFIIRLIAGATENA